GLHVRQHARRALHPRPPSRARSRARDLGVLGAWVQVLERDRGDRRRSAPRRPLLLRSRSLPAAGERAEAERVMKGSFLGLGLAVVRGVGPCTAVWQTPSTPGAFDGEGGVRQGAGP